MTLEENVEELKERVDKIVEMLTPENIIQYTEDEVARLQESLKELREELEGLVNSIED